MVMVASECKVNSCHSQVCSRKEAAASGTQEAMEAIATKCIFLPLSLPKPSLNVSEPGEIAFEAVEELCGPHLGRAVAASGVDLEADGRDELVILGEGIIRLERFHPERQTTDLIDLLDTDDPRRNCEAGAMAATDLRRG